jgi:hypothetical protein
MALNYNVIKNKNVITPLLTPAQIDEDVMRATSNKHNITRVFDFRKLS